MTSLVYAPTALSGVQKNTTLNKTITHIFLHDLAQSGSIGEKINDTLLLHHEYNLFAT